MRIREVGWALFLAGLPFAHFLWPKLDLSHAQATWSALWLAILWAASFGQPQRLGVPNRPLGLWIGWVALTTWWAWLQTVLIKEVYPTPLLMGLVHAMLLVIFYQLIAQTWTVKTLQEVCRWIARACLVVMGYCLLQMANLDQFLNSIDTDLRAHDVVVGTIGNPSQLGLYLALCLPVLLAQPAMRWRWAVGLCVGLVLLTKSAVAVVSGFLVFGWWACWQKPRWRMPLAVAVSLGFLWVCVHLSFLNPSGRLDAWQEFYRLTKSRLITGWGFGFVYHLSTTISDRASPIFQWRHVHNAYFQTLIELGVVGLGLVGWAIARYWKLFWQHRRVPVAVMCSAIFLVFLFSSALNFPDHRWVLGSLGMVGYAGLFALVGEPC